MIESMGFVLLCGAVGMLAVLAQHYRGERDILAIAVMDAHGWIDEIIEALENKDEEQGNKDIDSLVAQFSNDERSGDH